VFIRDFQYSDDGSKACLLICDTDGDAPGASFANLDTDIQRDVDKEAREGRPESAHLLANLDAEAGHATRYLALLEESSRLPRGLIERYVNALLKIVCKQQRATYTAPHVDGSVELDGRPRMQPFRAKMALQGHLSDDFRADLEAGKLRGISLETSSADKVNFGEARSVAFRRNDIKLRPAGSWKDNPMGKVQDALHIGNANKFENARIVFQTQDGTSHVAILDTETGNLVNEGYIKRSRLDGFDHLLSEASRSIDIQIRDKMNSLW
jgi:hypothetical protein